MKITILSQKNATDYLPESEKRSILIRLGDPNYNFDEIKYLSQYRDVLELKFHDVEKEWDLPSYIIPFTKDDAEMIKNFVLIHLNNISEIVVHCYAGMSRSAGIALSLSWYLGEIEQSQYIIDSKKYLPNLTCIEYMTQVLNIFETHHSWIEKERYLKNFDKKEEKFDW